MPRKSQIHLRITVRSEKSGEEGADCSIYQPLVNFYCTPLKFKGQQKDQLCWGKQTVPTGSAQGWLLMQPVCI